jgi:hypothetical protein
MGLASRFSIQAFHRYEFWPYYISSQANIKQTAFTEEELPPDEFYFGDPAAWIFDNLWTIE